MAPDMLMGYPTFVVSIFGIGLLTAVIGDLASQLGCTISLKDSITAIGFVALGTSVPGTNKELRKLENIALTLEVVALVRVVVNMLTSFSVSIELPRDIHFSLSPVLHRCTELHPEVTAPLGLDTPLLTITHKSHIWRHAATLDPHKSPTGTGLTFTD
ncbi:Sodium/calcium exchanger 1 [Portunus trituberculatus]|uniref:Sodium/calcium exchanger 1 n=1 Tax=Portunus trituberculatus TaxID=210409 RepID=A0A5B7D5I5_PORTR|nr:Sodium/calcium exchanger 1 [Portunus trituberculatus]